MGCTGPYRAVPCCQEGKGGPRPGLCRPGCGQGVAKSPRCCSGGSRPPCPVQPGSSCLCAGSKQSRASPRPPLSTRTPPQVLQGACAVPPSLRASPSLAAQAGMRGREGRIGPCLSSPRRWVALRAERAPGSPSDVVCAVRWELEKRVGPALLACFPGKEERAWLGGAGGAAFKMQSAQSLWSPPACWGGAAHAGGLLPDPGGALAAAAAALPHASTGKTGRRCSGAAGGAPAAGTSLPQQGGSPGWPRSGGASCLGVRESRAAGPAGGAALLAVTHAGACLAGSLPGFFAYQPKDFLVFFNYRLRILLQKGAVGIMREDSG
nr:translation initiation factor IF-2-like [Anser cygnoides]